MSAKKPNLLDKSPWSRNTLIGFSAIVNIAAGGILAGINWRRMGKNHLVWPTIFASVFAWIVSMFLLWRGILGEPSSGRSVLMLVWGLLGCLLSLWQKNEYQAWKESHPEAQPAGWSVPLLVLVPFAALTIWWVYSMIKAGSL